MTHTPRLKRVLLIEDNKTDVILTKRVFEKVGFDTDIVVASDGETALQMLRQEGLFADMPLPDLILTDINMPGKSGMDVLREVKAEASLRHLPVVMLTTSNAERDVYESYQHYASGYIVKPSNLASFSKAVEALQNYWSNTVEVVSHRTA